MCWVATAATPASQLAVRGDGPDLDAEHTVPGPSPGTFYDRPNEYVRGRHVDHGRLMLDEHQIENQSNLEKAANGDRDLRNVLEKQLDDLDAQLKASKEREIALQAELEALRNASPQVPVINLDDERYDDLKARNASLEIDLERWKDIADERMAKFDKTVAEFQETTQKLTQDLSEASIRVDDLQNELEEAEKVNQVAYNPPTAHGRVPEPCPSSD